jgi:hypothetical protein
LRRLWVFHLLIGVSTVGLVLAIEGRSSSIGLWQIVGATSVALLFVASVAAYPQIVFKPQERWLQIRHDGMATRIKSMRREYRWSEVVALTEFGDTINIGLSSGNAFIVPRRAFANDADRTAFLNAALQWSGRRV